MLLISILSATEGFAQTVGTLFTIDNVTYRITKKELLTHNNEVGIYTIGGTGVVTIPSQVTNAQDKEVYKVTSVIPWLDKQVKDEVTDIILPEGLTTIPEGCFRSLKFSSISIPSTCTSIGTQCFMDCQNFKQFKVASGNMHFKTIDGVLFTHDGKELVYYPSAKKGDYRIPSDVTTVRPYAFSQCDDIGTLTIPASVTNMSFDDTKGSSILTTAENIKVEAGNPKFCDIDGVLCSSDKKTLLSYPARRTPALSSQAYKIPDGITAIAPRAFYVSSIKSIDLNNTQTIGKSAFQFSYSLSSVAIGANIDSIAEGAFVSCNKLQTITADTNNPRYKAENNVLFNKSGDHLILAATAMTGSYTVPETVTHIDGHAFYATALSSVAISKNVTSIGKSAFAYSNAETVTIAEGSKLKTISSMAFAYMKKIKNFTIPASVITIADHAFANMAEIENITIADNSQLTNLYARAFSNNPKLKTLKFAGTTTALTTIPEGLVANDPLLESFVIPSTVVTIGNNAFQNTPALATVTFAAPASITEIKNNAFAGCGITSIELPSTVTTIKSQAFDNCKNLKTIEIPATVTTIDIGAFNMCETLTSFNVSKDNTKYSSLDGMLCDKSKKTLIVFPAGKADSKYTLVPYFEKVAAYAFYGSEKVTNVTFPRTVTTIENRALALCKNLQSLSFMGTDNVPALSDAIIYNSSNPKNISVYVRKDWYENTANDATIRSYNTTFKEVHPSFVSSRGYDRGTEFFPTSMTNVGAISFYTERTSVILDKNATEDATATPDRFGKTFPGKIYEVSSILDFAYENTSKVKAIVALADMSYIGMNAFKGSSIRELYFVGNVPGNLGSVDYEQPASYPFKDGQSIYVKRSKVHDYKTKWEVDGHMLGITAEIPQTTSSYGSTRCYPFDVKYNNSGDVRPYLPVDFSHMTGVNPYAKARRIDDGYVPAYLGVLLHSQNAATSSSYCEMTDAQDHHTVNDPSGMYSTAGYKMVGVVEDTQVMSDADNHLYAFSKSKGKFLKIKEDSSNLMPYFTAYLKLNSSNQGKAFSFRFDDDDTYTTGIENIDTAEKANADAPYYNLNGIRVNKPAKGIYIHNGKKVIIK